jgi:hypothetical protein
MLTENKPERVYFHMAYHIQNTVVTALGYHQIP